jgi:hypothetical protein
MEPRGPGRPKKKIGDVKLSKKEMYLGNPDLPSAFAKFEYTPDQVQELEKCKNDMLYFAMNYFYIVDPDEGKVQIKLYEFQKRILKGFRDQRFNVLLSPRQASKCFSGNTKLKIRNKNTGEIEEVSAELLYAN